MTLLIDRLEHYPRGPVPDDRDTLGLSNRTGDQGVMNRYVWFSTPMGTVGAMAMLARETAQIDLIAETPARRPDPPFLVIDEVGPPHSPAPGPTPRFGQLSCLRRQRSR
jgi:hypothetical protein